MVQVKLRGKRFQISVQDLKGLNFDNLETRKGGEYYVLIEDKEIPIKRALYSILKKKGIDLTLLDFTTQDAVRVFRKLELPIVVKSKKNNLLRFAGAIKEGKNLNAVEDKGKAYEA